MMTFDIPDYMVAEGITDVRWENSVFKNLKTLGPKQKGKRFEQIIPHILTQMGENVGKRISSEHDFSVDGISCELKASTTTQGTDDQYSFLQIRPDQDYKVLVLATFCFDGTIEIYKVPKEDVLKMIEDKVFAKQHGGNKANSRTFCYNGTMAKFKDYLWYTGKFEG